MISGRLAMGCALMLLSSSAAAYIDPGVTYALLQWLFLFIFGSAAAFIVQPWTWIKRWFRKTEPEGSAEEDVDSEQDSSADSADA